MSSPGRRYVSAGWQFSSWVCEIHLANEDPYRRSDDQEISLARYNDDGRTWSRATTFCFRAGHRDGMPVPLVLNGNKGIVVAIEDNAVDRKFRPAIISAPMTGNWNRRYADGSDPRRWWALAQPPVAEVNAAAPYIRQFPTGETVLSCQIHKAGAGSVMAVFIGDTEAKNFASRTIPFKVGKGKSGKWNSLFIKNIAAVTAISGTTISGITGLWAIDGRLVKTFAAKSHQEPREITSP